MSELKRHYGLVVGTIVFLSTTTLFTWHVYKGIALTGQNHRHMVVLSKGIAEFVRQNDSMPDMSSIVALKSDLRSVGVKEDVVFYSVWDRHPYVLNTSLSKVPKRSLRGDLYLLCDLNPKSRSCVLVNGDITGADLVQQVR